MTEKVVRFGPEDGLVGVVAEPAAASDADAPVVVFVNAGLLHRAGPYCWYTTLARQLAGQGFRTLRFDLSGVGDSAPRKDGADEFQRALLDIGAAFDFLARTRSARRFVLIGLCSGAVFAHHAAVADPRVAGLVLLDAYAYPTLGYHLRYYRTRLLRLSSWCGFVRRAAGRLVPALAARSAQHHDDFFVAFPPQARARTELEALLRRDAALLFLYTGELADRFFNHRKQFREMFGDLDPSGRRLDVDYLERADHLLSDPDLRAATLARIASWMERFAPPPAAGAPVPAVVAAS